MRDGICIAEYDLYHRCPLPGLLAHAKSILNYYYHTGGIDYQDVGVQTFVFNSSVRNYTLSIPIINDDIFELAEELRAVLKFASPRSLGVKIVPTETIITILDDDGENMYRGGSRGSSSSS